MPSENAGAGSRAVLVLDDSPLQILQLRRLLAGCGLELLAASSLADAQELIEAQRPVLLLVELWNVQENGFELGSRLMEQYGIPAVLLSASGRPTDRAWAARLGFACALSCPPSRRSLLRACAKAGLVLADGGEAAR